jgi:hypothetical protein
MSLLLSELSVARVQFFILNDSDSDKDNDAADDNVKDGSSIFNSSVCSDLGNVINKSCYGDDNNDFIMIL